MVTYDTVLDLYGGNNTSGRSAYKKQIIDDLHGHLTIKDDIVGQAVLGSSEFLLQISSAHLSNQLDRERPALKRINNYLTRGVVLDCLEKELGVPLDKALGTKRQLVMMMLYKYAGLKNHEIGLLYNCDYSTVSQARKRLLLKAEKDKVLQRRIGATEDTLSKIKI
jgi:hypothetical protein